MLKVFVLESLRHYQKQQISWVGIANDLLAELAAILECWGLDIESTISNYFLSCVPPPKIYIQR